MYIPSCYLLENCHGCIRGQDVVSVINEHLFVVSVWITTTEIFFIEFKCFMEKCCGVLENWTQTRQAKMRHLWHDRVHMDLKRSATEKKNTYCYLIIITFLFISTNHSQIKDLSPLAILCKCN